ncbi:acyl-CoA dehydrogenase NM domain-like protein [Polyporus arcularius HHB13444]|uniref:Acyl-CoA dehydrogenase NM domain-like protein n=1 Tax=Polyporus arcularius HHB13444 TaxID=1314778 RepID=A0A5C3NRE5_9APHY|nr:acyl-CoA dehydrogenase NM domain-like protein [Polyporus arcularius HHB13444]
MRTSSSSALRLRRNRQIRRCWAAGTRRSSSMASLCSDDASFYDTDVAGLTEDQGEFRNAVQEFAGKEVAPTETDRKNQLPPSTEKLGAMGLLGITVKSAYGWLALGYFNHTLAMEELLRASGSVHRWATDAQKAKYLPDLVAMSHVVSMRLRAERADGGLSLTGNNPETGSKGITAFIIEKGWAGFSTHQELDKLGMRGSDTQLLGLVENVLGPADGGARVPISGPDLERLVLSGWPLGLMQTAFDIAVECVHDRKQFGQAVGEFQLMQGKITDMYTKLHAPRSYVYAVAKVSDAGKVSQETEKMIRIAGLRSFVFAEDSGDDGGGELI